MNRKAKKLVCAALISLLATVFSGCAAKTVDTVAIAEQVNIIKRIDAEQLAGETVVAIEGSAPLTYTAFKLSDPDRLVVDISRADVNAVKGTKSVNNGTISYISAIQYDGEGSNIGRIEIVLTESTGYTIEKDGLTLYVHVSDVPAVVESEEEVIKTAAADNKTVEESVQEAPVVDYTSSIMDRVGRVEAAGAAKYIADIAVETGDNGVAVFAIGDGDIGNYNAFQLENPRRMVVDILGVKNLFRKNSLEVDSPLLRSIRIGQHSDKVRLVLDMPGDSDAGYSVKKAGKALVIGLGDAVYDQVFSEDETEAAETEAAEAVAAEAVVAEAVVADITGINFKQMPGASRITVSANVAVASFDVKELASGKLALDLSGVKLPRSLQRSLDTSEFVSPVKLISSYQMKKAPENVVRVVIAHEAGASYDVSSERGEVFVDFERVGPEGKIAGVVADVVEEKGASGKKPVVAAADRKSLAVENKGVEQGADEKSVDEAQLYYVNECMANTKGVFEYKEVDIHNLLRLLADTCDINIVAGDDVKGKVTLRLKNVSLNDGLDIALKRLKLGKRFEKDNLLIVAPAASLQKEEDAELARKNALKKLSEEVDDVLIKDITLEFVSPSDIVADIEPLLTEGRGKIRYKDGNDYVTIVDVPSRISIIRARIAEVDRPPKLKKQVLIEARIVEIDTNYSQSLGVQWGGQYSKTSPDRTFPNSVTAGMGAGGSFALSPPAAGATGTGTAGTAGGVLGFNFGHINNTISLDLKLSALETKGVSKIISRPRVITINGVQASIQQGFSIPFETTSESGTKTEFIDANLNLTVTPVVSGDYIELDIKAAKNEPDYARTGAGGKPSINKKEATTNVMIKDGDTTVIGGIFTQKKGDTRTGVPYLSKIPLLGALFRSSVTSDDKAELLIFITPRILKETP